MKDDTKLVTSGRDREKFFGAVNPPVVHASTILFPTAEALRNSEDYRVRYARHGTPGTHAFRDAMTEIEGGHQTLLTPSGLSACTVAMLAFLRAGDHLLMTDAAYGPTRAFCSTTLKRFGVEVTYYDPCAGAGIADLFQDNTRVVFMESPGSLTFEVQDVPAICKAAKDKGITTILDNTWATPLYFKAFEHGVDISVQAATKYIVGHSDAMLGTITASEKAWPKLFRGHRSLGMCGAPDDAYLTLRGLRTLSVRLERHFANALKLAEWFKGRDEIDRVLFPPLPTDPGHEIWKRDFKSGTGLFGVIFKECPQKQCDAFLDAMKLFGMGYSWGGYESLLIPSEEIVRSASKWEPAGPVFRVSAGLEDPDDLIADLEQAFEAFHKGAS